MPVRNRPRAIAPLALAPVLALALGACGSSGSATSTQTIQITSTPAGQTQTTALKNEIGQTKTSGKVAIKVTKVTARPTLTYIGGRRSYVTPNGRAKTNHAPDHFQYVYITTQVTNHATTGLNLACGKAITIAVGDNTSNTYTPVEGLDELQGNPSCSDTLAPGKTAAMTYAFLTNTSGTINALEFATAGTKAPTLITF